MCILDYLILKTHLSPFPTHKDRNAAFASVLVIFLKFRLLVFGVLLLSPLVVTDHGLTLVDVQAFP